MVTAVIGIGKTREGADGGVTLREKRRRRREGHGGNANIFLFRSQACTHRETHLKTN